MLAPEFLASLSRSTALKRVYCFFGEESFFFRRGLDELRKRFSPATPPAVEHVKFDFSLTRLLAHLTTTGLWSEKRMGVVYGVDSLARKDQKTLGDFAAAPSADSLLILRVEHWEAPPWLKPGPQVELVQCRPLRGPDLSRWVDRLLVESAVRLDPKAQAWLVDRAGSSLAELEQCAKRISWMHTGHDQPLTTEQIQDCVADTAERTTIQLGDAIARKNPPEALLALGKLLEWADSPLMVIGGLAGYVRREVAPRQDRWRSGGGSMSAEEGLRMLSVLAKLDSEIKSSRLADSILMRRALFSLLGMR